MLKAPSKKSVDPDLDSDHDGLTDEEERLIFGTNPYDPDTDHDGMNDGDEVRAGRNPRGGGLIKNLFIPHAGNNYEPQILRPKRLFWHAAVAISVKLIVVSAALLFPITAWLTPDVLNEQSQKILELTNQVRLKMSVPTLIENLQLKNAALGKAEDMLVKQYFAHTNPQKQNLTFWLKRANYKYAVAGENLALGFTSAENVVNAWIKSKTHYANLIDPDFQEVGIAMVSGSYNQRETTLAAQLFGSAQRPRKTTFLNNSKTLPNTHDPSQDQFAMRMIQVLGEKDDQAAGPQAPMETPRLIFPSAGDRVNNNPVKIKIWSETASQVTVQPAITSTPPIIASWEAGFWVADLWLEDEGENHFTFTATRGEENITAADQTLILDSIGPIVDVDNTALKIDYPEGKKEIIVFGSAVLTPDTQTAGIDFSSYHIDLTPGENNTWEGSLILFNEADRDTVFDPAVLPTITAVDDLGNTTIADIQWDRVIPSHTSIIKQYFLAKDQSSVSSALGRFFSWTSIYYQIILLLVGAALILNIIVKIRQQNPRVIVSSVLFLALVAAMLVF